jgi:EAL domain-containing protein (putative c-di-GMP-specific phosphodiesterase class I)
VRRALEESGLSPDLLELEFREESLLKETSQASATLAALRELGVVCALDDFGTGLSAIARVRSLPLDRLNIHHSLVHNIADAEDAGLIRGIVGLAHDLRLQVIAEGVESEDQMSFLQDVGCDEVQGFHVRLPVPAGEMTELLRRRFS